MMMNYKKQTYKNISIKGSLLQPIKKPPVWRLFFTISIVEFQLLQLSRFK